MFIETQGLKKAYKGREVVKGISVRVDRGTVVGLLGPNGAGKTTTFYMIVGLVDPDAGVVSKTEVPREPYDLVPQSALRHRLWRLNGYAGLGAQG